MVSLTRGGHAICVGPAHVLPGSERTDVTGGVLSGAGGAPGHADLKAYQLQTEQTHCKKSELQTYPCLGEFLSQPGEPL